jgi:hypothetical protein
VTYPPNIVHGSADLIAQREKSYYMQVGHQLYGPYTSDLMQQYCDEGRVGPQSLLSLNRDAGFKPAKDWPEFTTWTRGRYDPLQNAAQTMASDAMPSVYFVIADISPRQQIGFIKSLQGLGTVHRLTETVWVLGSAMKIENIREVLSQTLTLEDRLFIHDSFSNRAGWFNIGEGLDEKLRNLWVDTAQSRKSRRQ